MIDKGRDQQGGTLHELPIVHRGIFACRPGLLSHARRSRSAKPSTSPRRPRSQQVRQSEENRSTGRGVSRFCGRGHTTVPHQGEHRRAPRTCQPSAEQQRLPHAPEQGSAHQNNQWEHCSYDSPSAKALVRPRHSESGLPTIDRPQNAHLHEEALGEHSRDADGRQRYDGQTRTESTHRREYPRRCNLTIEAKHLSRCPQNGLAEPRRHQQRDGLNEGICNCCPSICLPMRSRLTAATVNAKPRACRQPLGDHKRHRARRDCRARPNRLPPRPKVRLRLVSVRFSLVNLCPMTIIDLERISLYPAGWALSMSSIIRATCR